MMAAERWAIRFTLFSFLLLLAVLILGHIPTGG
jgi:hypothetical protein